MMRIQPLVRCFVALGCIVAATGHGRAEGNPEAGSAAFESCRSCHGTTASGNPERQGAAPRLGGQHARYIVAALDAYASGARKHAGMQRIAAALSKKEKEDIAAYVARFELKQLPIPMPDAGTGTIAKTIETCRVCHGEGGNSFVPEYPRINGQDRDYLVSALKSYGNGNRTNPTMVYVVKQLSDETLNAIADYYAAQKEGLTDIER